jgi:hypothetical protein
MPTKAKIEANRQNALASTGPKSVEGKGLASTNAIRHRLLSFKARRTQRPSPPVENPIGKGDQIAEEKNKK